MRGPLTIAASLVAEHRLQTRRLSSCGSRAQLLRGMWDLPRPGLEPVSPALAGRFSTTAPPGKPYDYNFIIKDTNQNQPNEEIHRVKPGRVLNTELLCPLSVELGHVTLLKHQGVVHKPGSSTELQCPEFLLGFHYTAIID